MKIGIVGLGVVGGTCKYGFEKLGHEVKVHDIKLDTKIEDVLDTEICYICVPTPQLEGGECDVSIVESVVDELVSKGYTEYYDRIAIKSTVKPGTTRRLVLKYNKANICFVPEFLRERCAIADFTENHDLLAIGCNEPDNYRGGLYDTVVECHGNYPKQTVRMTPTEAELLKYYSNIFNAMRITFANEMYEVANKVGADYNKVKDAFIKRGTTTDMYLDVNDSFRGYGGVCLPKDTAAMAHFVKELGLDLKLFETIEAENAKFKKTVPKGMRE